MAEKTIPSHNVFVVKTPSFEGPLDLLLDLIERRKLSISEISLSTVADDFIAYVRSLTDFPIAMSAHFILVASTLLLIKSRTLLPGLELTTEEQESIEELERRLTLLRRSRELSRYIQAAFGKRFIFSPRDRSVVPIFSPDAGTSIAALSSYLTELLHNLPKAPIVSKAIVAKVISLEEVINNLTERIKANLKLRFRDFASVGKKEKVHVIVSFLAMLELVKQGVISVRQDKHFADIFMETERLDVPRYS